MSNSLLKPVLESIPENNRMEQIWVLAKTDFLKRYYGSVLGVVWAFINPVVQFFIYYFVFAYVLPNRIPSFAIFLFLGLILFMFFSDSSNQGLYLLKAKKHIIENIPYHFYDIYIASTLSGIFSFCFNITMYIILSVIVGATLSGHIVFFPLLILNLVLLIFSAQLILSVLFPLVNDITHLWDKTRLALFWLSGIVFDIMSENIPLIVSKILLLVNPLAGIIMNTRRVLIYGQSVIMDVMLYDLAFGIVVFLLSLWLNKRYFYRAMERI